MNAFTAEYTTFSALWKEFREQVLSSPLANQRNHDKRLAAGKANHVTESTKPGMAYIPGSQVILQAVVVSVNGKARKRVPLDGYHRLQHWSKHSCPFETLLLVTHQIEASTESEAADRLDKLFRSVNSLQACKRNVDFYAAAIRAAGIEAKSKAYDTAEGAVSVFSRIIGKGTTPIPKMVATIKADVNAHRQLDSIFSFAETHLGGKTPTSRKSYQSVYFSPGVALAFFRFFSGRKDAAIVVSNIINSFELILAGRDFNKSSSYASENLAQAMRNVADDAFLRKSILAGLKVNKETEYNMVADYIGEVLNLYFDAVVPKKRIAA